MKGNTIIVGGLNTTLTSLDRSARYKIKKVTKILNDTLEQLNLIDVCRTVYIQKPQNTLCF